MLPMPSYVVYVCDRCGRSFDSRSGGADGWLAPGWVELTATPSMAPDDWDDESEVPEPESFLLCDACSPGALGELRTYVLGTRRTAH
jgi:hypothetical protein